MSNDLCWGSGLQNGRLMQERCLIRGVADRVAWSRVVAEIVERVGSIDLDSQGVGDGERRTDVA